MVAIGPMKSTPCVVGWIKIGKKNFFLDINLLDMAKVANMSPKHDVKF